MCRRRWCSSVAGFVVVVLAGILIWPSSSSSAQDTWTWQNPLPQGNLLSAIWGSSGTDIYAVGAVGTIIHYDGATWTAQASGIHESLVGVWGSSANDVYAVGGGFYRPVILHYDGTEWQNQYVNGDELRGVWGSSANNIFVVGRQGTILHYDGTSWSAMPGAGWTDLNAVWGSSANDVYAVGRSGTILHYDGATWTATTQGTQDWLYVWGTGPSNVYFVNYNRTVIHYDGATWSASPEFWGYPKGLWGTSSNDIFAVGVAVGDVTGAIWHTDGAAWTAVPGSFPDTLIGVWGSSATNVYAVGSSGAILHYDGSSWTPMHRAVPSGELHASWASAANNIFAVGEGGSILHFDGTAWGAVNSPTTAALEAIWGSSSNDIFAVGAGVILHFDGANWSVMESNPPYSHNHGVWGTGAGDVFVVGSEGAILHYNGVSWRAMNSDTKGELNAVWGSSSTDVFAVGGFGTIVHYDGTSWSSVPSGTRYNLSDVWGTGSSHVLAVGDNGTILHFDGANWRALSGPSPSEWYWDIWGTGVDDVYLIGDRSTIYHFDGTAWNAMETHVSGFLHDVWGDCARGVYAVGAAILRHPGCWLNLTVPAGNTGIVKSTPPGINCGPWLATVCSAAFEYGTPVTLSVSPHPSASFLGWSGACSGAGSCTVTMDSNKAVAASFALPLNVIKAGDGNGAVTSSPPIIDCGPSCQAVVLGGTAVTLTATAGAFSTFDGWTFPTDSEGFPTGYCAINLPCVLTMNAAKEVTATFTLHVPPGTFPLVVTKAGNGSGTVTSSPAGIDCGPTCSAVFPGGETVLLTAAPGPFMVFAGWSGSCSGTGSCSVTMDAAEQVTATFVQQTFLLTVGKAGSGSGTVTSSPAGIDCGLTCSASFAASEVVTLTAVPDVGMVFTGWSGACSGTGACSFTMAAAKSVTAVFTIFGAVTPQAGTLYYGDQLAVLQAPSAAATMTATRLVAFKGPALAEIYLVGVQGSEPYIDETATGRLINRLLLTGCSGGPCSAVNCTYYGPDGVFTVAVTGPIATDFLYIPFTQRH